MIECVLNFSEGRRQSVIRSAVSSLAPTGCQVLDVHSDPDHHRSVVTFVGNPTDTRAGAVALTACVVRRIDLRMHQGVHPRIGAVDVIPFVPLGTETIDTCVDIAVRTGEQIAAELDLPVILYGAAARCEAHRNLADLRRGGWMGLAERLAQPGGGPDFGPRMLHPSAGAVAVGARGLLVAFNVNLCTSDLPVARRIASVLRESNGGLPGVKAIGLPLKTADRVQVSMNLTDPRATGVAAAFRAVRELAVRNGVAVAEAEIVGLVPRFAVEGITSEEMNLDYDLGQVILEERLP